MVQPEQLAVSRFRYRAGRALATIKRWIWLPLLLGVGFHVNRNVNWVSRVPTGVLLAFPLDHSETAWYELLDRLKTDKLSPDQVKTLTERSFSASLRLRGPNPYPAGLPVPFKIKATSRLSHSIGEAYGGEPAITVTGQVTVTRDSDDYAVWKTVVGGRPPVFQMPPLKPGSYRIGFTGNAVLDHGGTVVHKWPVSVNTTIVVESLRLTRYVKHVWSEDMATSLRQNMGASVHLYGKQKISMSITCWDSRIPLAGDIWVRASGTDRYHKLSRQFPFAPYVSYFSINLSRVRGLRGAKYIDIRITPNTASAFMKRMDEMFFGEIEWLRVPIEDVRGASCWGLPKPTSPSRVSQAEE